jgi:hypothetical protein
MPATQSRLAATLAITMLAIPTWSSALARRSANSEPTRPAPALAPLLLRASDAPGLVTYPFAFGSLSLWESAERETAKRELLRQSGWRRSARRTFRQSPTSLYGVLSIESRVLDFSAARGARRAFRQVTVSGLHRVSGSLPLGDGAPVFAHMDTVDGVAELALATQARQGNVDLARHHRRHTRTHHEREPARHRTQAGHARRTGHAGVAGGRAKEGRSAFPRPRTLPRHARGAREWCVADIGNWYTRSVFTPRREERSCTTSI